MNHSQSKIRVMHITHDLAIGGLQQVIVNICSKINREKFEPSVLCLRESGEFVPEIEKMGIKVLKIKQTSSSTDYFSFFKVAKILKQERIDVIHTHNTHPLIDGTIGAHLSRVKTIIHTDHARNFPDKKRYMFAEWVMSNFVYKIAGVSDHTSDNLIKYEHISRKKIITIPNGIDGDKYNISIDTDKKKESLGIKNKHPVIGLGVRLAEQKGLKYLLCAMPEIIKIFPDIALVIAGRGDLEDSLKQEAEIMGIGQSVFFPGPRLDMPEILQIFDLYTLPSLWEGMPMVLLEAMAAKCPIVATDVGGNSSVIKHGFNGSLIKAMDPDSMADEIIKLLSNDVLRRQYISNSFELFQNKFSSQIMTQMYERLYLREE